jgi:hypothetical protein
MQGYKIQVFACNKGMANIREGWYYSTRPCGPKKRKKAGKNTRSVCCCFPKLKLNNNMRKLYCNISFFLQH